MDAKNKAEELYTKFRGMSITVVKEIIEENKLYKRKLTPALENRLRYWQEVKQEIEKLKHK